MKTSFEEHLLNMFMLNSTTALHRQGKRMFDNEKERLLQLFADNAFRHIHPTLQFHYAKDFDQLMAQKSLYKFASLKVDARDKGKFETWIKDQKITAFQTLFHLTGDGYKVSVSWIVKQNSFCVSVSGRDDMKFNKNVTMTTWSDDMEECIMLAGYKHYMLCDGGEWPTEEEGNRWG